MTISEREQLVQGWGFSGEDLAETMGFVEHIIDGVEQVEKNKGAHEMYADIRKLFDKGAVHDALAQSWIEQSLENNPEVAVKLEAREITARDIHEAMDASSKPVQECILDASPC